MSVEQLNAKLAELKEELESREVLESNEKILLGKTKTALFTIKIELEKEERGLFGFNIPTQRAINILKDIDIPD